MYSDVDYPSDLEEELLSALALLRSTDADSTDKLRKMLQDAIRGKQMPLPNFPGEMMDRKVVENIEEREGPHASKDAGNADKKCNESEIIDCLVNKNIQEESLDSRHFEEYLVDSLDIPRISIPDEGPNEETLCKVCNASKLGPMILLECQDCQEAYHPLCHYPPVIDIDVYDPRLVWRCSNCIETQFANNEIITDAGETRDDMENGAAALRKPHSQDEDFRKARFLRSTNFSRKRTATGSQLKKRIGLKQSINRTFTKGF